MDITTSTDVSDRCFQRAKILLLLSEGVSNKAVATQMGISPSTVGDVLKKFHSAGLEGTLKDKQRSGRHAGTEAKAKVWVSSLAYTVPKDLPDGPYTSLWSMNSLTQYVRQHCEAQGFPCLKDVSKSQIRSFLHQYKLKPQEIQYYLEEEGSNLDPLEKMFTWYIKELTRS